VLIDPDGGIGDVLLRIRLDQARFTQPQHAKQPSPTRRRLPRQRPGSALPLPIALSKTSSSLRKRDRRAGAGGRIRWPRFGTARWGRCSERSGAAAGRHFRRDPAPPSRDRRWCPPHAGAAHPCLAGAERRRAGRHLPTGASAGAAGAFPISPTWAITASASPVCRWITGSITSAWPFWL